MRTPAGNHLHGLCALRIGASVEKQLAGGRQAAHVVHCAATQSYSDSSIAHRFSMFCVLCSGVWQRTKTSGVQWWTVAVPLPQDLLSHAAVAGHRHPLLHRCLFCASGRAAARSRAVLRLLYCGSCHSVSELSVKHTLAQYLRCACIVRSLRDVSAFPTLLLLGSGSLQACVQKCFEVLRERK